MTAKPTFKAYNLSQFEEYIRSVEIKRNINHIQIHHTWKPRKTDYKGEETIVGMWRYHTQTRGWNNIGQHFSVAPDGLIWNGRSLEEDPAGISGHNSGGIMFELIGNFDKGEEKLEGKQLEAIIGAIRVLLEKFGLDYSDIVFHRDYSSKTCPGTGIGKEWFIQEVRNGTAGKKDNTFENAPNWKQEGILWLYQQGFLASKEWKNDIEESLPLWAEAMVLQRLFRKHNGQ